MRPCHTGRFTYKNTAVLVSGGPAVTDVFKFQQAVGLALVYTRYVPFRFGRFADRVLGTDASNDAKDALKTQLDEVLATYKWVKDREDHANPKKFEEGYTRLDALNRIGKQVFSVAVGEPNNYAAPSAPVNFPPIWNAPWFLWVQYDGSIMQPMVRNAGEALGVVAWLNMKGGGSPMFSSSAQVRELYAIEQQIAGKEPNATDGFTGLQSPKWPEDILPRIDRTLAATGEGLYKENCQHCHLPPVGTPEFWASPQWKSLRDGGQKYLDLPMIELKRIGTDPEQANGLMNRRITLPANLDLGAEFGPALGTLVERSVNRWYDDQQPSIAEAERDEINGRRPNGIQAVPKYRLRPLNGIWATPPYLHNGSVPTVYALLSPVQERPRTFYLGNREYDPVNLGYVTDTLPHGFLIDTSLAGNRNTGHEFNDNRTKDGVIGRSLKPEERRAIIEFLKTQ
jgi:hypothetical protein